MSGRAAGRPRRRLSAAARAGRASTSRSTSSRTDERGPARRVGRRRSRSCSADERLRIELTAPDPSTDAAASRSRRRAVVGGTRPSVLVTRRAVEGRAVIVVGIDTSTPQVSVAIGTEAEILGRIQIAGHAPARSRSRPRWQQLLDWTGVDARPRRRVRRRHRARGCSPGSASASRPRRRWRRSPARRSSAISSLDALAYASSAHRPTRSPRWSTAAAGEVFRALYRAGPGRGPAPDRACGRRRRSTWRPSWQAHPGDVLAVGDGAILYRDVLHERRAPASSSPRRRWPIPTRRRWSSWRCRGSSARSTTGCPTSCRCT